MNLKNLYQNEYSFEETINENSFKIESFSHLSIEDTITNSNDSSVKAKELYLIVENNDALFADKINQIACYHNNLGWIFYQPKIGDIAYIQSFEGFYYFDGEGWNVFNSGNSSSGGENGAISGGSSKKIENPFFLGFRMSCKELPDNNSWLKSDATLKDGAIYAGLYNKLVDVNTNGVSGTMIVGSSNYNTKELDGFVVLSSNDWLTIYQNNGIVDAYGIDETNQQFYLPYKEEIKRVLIEKKEQTLNNETWYNLYSDGWVEQGGLSTSTAVTFNFPIEMRDTLYYANCISQANSNDVGVFISNISKTSCKFNNVIGGGRFIVKGYTNNVSDVLQNAYYDYYYVGSIIENNAQINITKLSSKILELENRIATLEGN